MSMIDDAADAAAVDSAVGPVQEANGQPEAGCEPLPQLAAEAAPAADGLPSTMPAEAGSGAEPDAVSSGTNPEKKPRGRPFEPGQSGNPAGRPKGSRNRATRAIEALIDGEGEALGAKAVEKALAGDTTMLRVLMGMLVPPRRERCVEFDLPKVENAGDAPKASAAVIAACAAGELCPREAAEIMRLISTHVRIFEVAVAALEKAPGEKPADTPEFVNGVEISKHDPLYGQICQWEIDALRRRALSRKSE
jgi:Family of unknown function (DUF5681)